jgi:integrase
MQGRISDHPCRTTTPWNRGKLIGPKPPLKAKEIWSIRVRLQVAHRIRDLALFNLALDSKLRACDLVALRVDDVALNGRARSRAIIAAAAMALSSVSVIGNAIRLRTVRL